VNNVLGFPYIFRGALDVRATEINEAMKLAAVHALSDLAKEPVPAVCDDLWLRENRSLDGLPDPQTDGHSLIPLAPRSQAQWNPVLLRTHYRLGIR